MDPATLSPQGTSKFLLLRATLRELNIPHRAHLDELRLPNSVTSVHRVNVRLSEDTSV